MLNVLNVYIACFSKALIICSPVSNKKKKRKKRKKINKKKKPTLEANCAWGKEKKSPILKHYLVRIIVFPACCKGFVTSSRGERIIISDEAIRECAATAGESINTTSNRKEQAEKPGKIRAA